MQEFGAPQRRNVRYLTAFVQTDYEIQPRFTLTLGLNYDWANDDNLFDDNAEELAGRERDAAIRFLQALRLLQIDPYDGSAEQSVGRMPDWAFQGEGSLKSTSRARARSKKQIEK